MGVTTQLSEFCASITLASLPPDAMAYKND